MKKASFFSRSRAAFTLVEMLVAGAVSSLVLGSIGFSCVTLRRTFDASNFHMTSQNEQLRVMDYITRDLRSASSVEVQNNGNKLSALVPFSQSNPTSLKLGAPLLNLLSAPSQENVSRTVSYFVEGGQLLREEAGVITSLATCTTKLDVTRSGSFATVAVEFSPKFSRSSVAAAQKGTRLSSRIFLRNAAGN